MDGKEAAKRAYRGQPPLDPHVDGKRSKRRPYVRVTELRDLWQDVRVLDGVTEADSTIASRETFIPASKTESHTAVDDAGPGNVDALLVDDVLQLLAAQGEVFVSAEIAYLDPAYVATLMKPLVDHRLSRRSAALHFAGSASHGAALLSAVDELVNVGVLREELLALLWSDVGLLPADYPAVLLMLEESGVLFPITATASGAADDAIETASVDAASCDSVGASGRRWVMPMRLPRQQPIAIPPSWNHQLFRLQEGEVVCSAALDLGGFVPPGLIERLMAACYSLGKHHYFWRRSQGAGALIKVELSGGREARLLLDVVEAVVASDAPTTRAAPDFALHFEAFGPLQSKADVEKLLAQAQELLEHLLHDFPGMVASAATLHGAARWRCAEPQVKA